MTHDPALTTLAELVDHVKLHLTPDLGFDHLTDRDVRAIASLALHSLLHFGLTVVPTSSGGPDPRPLDVGRSIEPQVGRIEPSVLVAADLLAGAVWRSAMRRLGDLAEWLDARLESPS